MRKTIILSIILLIILAVIIPNFSYASEANLGLGDLNKYKGTSEDSTKIKNITGNILEVIRTIGIVISVVMLMVIGIKYMMGSVEEKADYKKTLIPYVIGAGILFTGSFLPQLIYNIVKQI